jgi:hypothetical protein
MENQDNQSTEELLQTPVAPEIENPQLLVTEEMRSHFYEMAKWAKFLGVVGFIMTGLITMTALTMGATLNALSENPLTANNPLLALGGTAVTILFILYAFLIFYPSLLLFQYSSNAKHGVLYGEQTALETAIGKIKSLFKFWGILTIIIISIYFLAIVAGAIGLASSM